jgi:hypothetical protein
MPAEIIGYYNQLSYDLSTLIVVACSLVSGNITITGA